MTTHTLDHVLDQRTRYLKVVVEDVYQPHNGAAVIRACDCFGVQDIHVISTRNAFRVDPDVVQGADRWITVHRGVTPEQETTAAVLTGLRDQGYAIAATTLRDPCIPIAELPLDRPVALVFGAEEQGLSDEAHALADYFVRIPMYGFTQSFNISVSAALSLFELTDRLRRSDLPWALSTKERQALKAEWARVDSKQ